jgi:RNA polymerase sigma-70 factor (ECF subfamily)
MADGNDRREEADSSVAATEGLQLGKSESLDRQQQIIALYHALRPSLCSYLSTLGLTADEAEDVIQESFLRLVPHRTDGQREENLRGWIFRVAHNIAMDVHRSSWRTVNDTGESEGRPVSDSIVDPAPNPEQAYLHEEHRQRVHIALAQLTEQQRNCILFRAEGLRYREIANALNISFQRAAELVRLGLVHLTGDL